MSEELLAGEPKAVGVYLALLHLRFVKGYATFTTVPSGRDIMSEESARKLFASYLAGRVDDAS